MAVRIQEIGADLYHLYDVLPGRFLVTSVFRVQVLDRGLGGFRLVEERVAEPFVRDHDDQYKDNPTAWAAEFDVSRWGILLATGEDRPVGGAAVAVDAPVYPMDRFQRPDLAVLWDIRIHPNHRGRGIGTMLFQHAVGWAQRQGRGQLGLETNSTNVPACRFFARQGCELGAIHRFGYVGCPEVAQDAMLLWYLDL